MIDIPFDNSSFPFGADETFSGCSGEGVPLDSEEEAVWLGLSKSSWKVVVVVGIAAVTYLTLGSGAATTQNSAETRSACASR